MRPLCVPSGSPLYCKLLNDRHSFHNDVISQLSPMTFDEILTQIIELLQHQGRVSYGALRRRFDLDEDYLEDIKTELIEAQRIAADEGGKVLVWVGQRGSGEEGERANGRTGEERLESRVQSPESKHVQSPKPVLNLVEGSKV